MSSGAQRMHSMRSTSNVSAALKADLIMSGRHRPRSALFADFSYRFNALAAPSKSIPYMSKALGNSYSEGRFVTRKLLVFAPLIVFAQAAPATPITSTASRNIALGGVPLTGVNLSGCEFSLDGALCPTATSVRAYVDKGFRAIRIPFRGAQVRIPAVVARIKAAADAATSQGVYVILDRHDYGATFDAAQAAWWVSFIKNFPDTKYVMIDTMNEPRTGASYQP
ncbi:MAG: hypothetical protein EOO77_33590, partial [Oxalobacteraceae bacterium]